MPPSYNTDPSADQGMADAVEEGVQNANAAATNEEQARIDKAERDAVAALWKEYEQARDFDKDARAQYAVDRRYTAGTANLDWAVSSNLIGAFVDILVSFLYARNPDVSVGKAPRIDNTGTKMEDDFAKTMELVISSLWKAPTARLKDTIRSQVRSTLSVGIGWIKVILVCKGTNIPEMHTQLNTIKDNIARLEALRQQVTVDAQGNQQYLTEDNEVLTEEELNAKTAQFRELEQSISKRLEVATRKALAIDFVAAEDMQVSLDVRNVTDNVNAGWAANAIYRPVKDLPSLFPGLKESDTRSAKTYYQRSVKSLSPLSEHVQLTGLADSNVDANEAEQYVAGESGSTGPERGIAFAKVVELWDRRTGHVKTMIDGVKKWAKQPYQPDYPTTRFFPYFNTAFFPVDGARHPQSLSWRLMKLQDEYCSMRSGQRLTRKRAAPGTLFNSSALPPEEIAKIERSTHQEFTGIKPTNPDQPLRDLFAEKPVAVGDMRLYDATPILADMEKISGVQEALQSSNTNEKTATEAEIQQSGFASRTTADRDVTESMLTDLANYTGELALTALDSKDVQRIAGANAFWPQGMAIDDLLTMVEIQIEAGTTGKPKSAGDKNAWGTIMPMLMENIMKIHQAQLMGDLPLAKSLTEVVKETMQRMGDESDVSRFIPEMPQVPATAPGMPGAPGAGPPAIPPGGPGAPVPPEMGGQPPEMGGAGGQPGLGDTLVPPELSAPNMAPPML